MKKILFAIGHKELENFIKKELVNENIFVGVTVYREGVIRAIGQKNPDILILRETLEGNENILNLIYEIRLKFPKLRIVFIAKERETGDELLSTLVSYGIYDILYGGKIQANKIVAMVRKQNEYSDVSHLQPMPVFDEKTNKVLFQAPETIIKEVIIEKIIEKPITETIIIEKEVDTKSLLVAKTESETNVIPKEDSELLVGKQKKEEPELVVQKENPKKNIFDKFNGKSNNQLIMDNLSKDEIIKQKIITFVGSKPGVGTTSIAFNTAVSLAQKGLKTIFIEINEKMPSVAYWYELGILDKGIDTALIAVEEEKHEEINKSIIKTMNLKKLNNHNLIDNYKKFPDNLDFMFFSTKYLTKDENIEVQEVVDMSLTKELFLYLIFQLEYDFVVIDVPSDISHSATKNAVLYSNKTFLVMTQDVSSIGYSIYQTHELSKRGINLNKKMYYVLNRFENSQLTIPAIKEWIEGEKKAGNITIIPIPIEGKEFINANFIGMPVILNTKNSKLKDSFGNIVQILKK